MSDGLFDAPDLFEPPKAKPKRRIVEETPAPIAKPERDPRFKPNPGYERGKYPPRTAGKKVRVELANGRIPVESWPTETTRWTITGDDFDVAFYFVP